VAIPSSSIEIAFRQAASSSDRQEDSSSGARNGLMLADAIAKALAASIGGIGRTLYGGAKRERRAGLLGHRFVSSVRDSRLGEA
jgi:hypothetical protein